MLYSFLEWNPDSPEKYLTLSEARGRPGDRVPGTARVSNTRLWSTYTTTSLISANAGGEIIIVGAELVCAIAAHPGTTGSRRDGKAKTVILRSDNLLRSTRSVHLGTNKRHRNQSKNRKNR